MEDVATPLASERRGNRLHLLDALRGFSIVSMIGFHFCYDLKFIFGMDLAWFAPPLQDIWRASISWTFLAIAGCTCALSRNNLKRAGRYGLLALAIYVVTSLASVDACISFGIIYCMAACTFVGWILEWLNLSPKGPAAAAVLLACFLFLLPLSSGYIGIGPLHINLPNWLYSTEYLAWLGFPGPAFVSGDYYPLLPFVLMYLAGSAMGWWWKERGFPQAFSEYQCLPLELIGLHPLVIYVAHQPILLLIGYLVSWR